MELGKGLSQTNRGAKQLAMLCFVYREEACVLVHGAEGTDTTLLVTALAQVILDADCRTLAGFQGLLEREWIQVCTGANLKEKRCWDSTGRGASPHLPCFVPP